MSIGSEPLKKKRNRESLESSQSTISDIDSSNDLHLREKRGQEIKSRIDKIDKQEALLACKTHLMILEQAMNQNTMMMNKYRSIYCDLQGNKKFERHCEVYRQLFMDLQESNRKLGVVSDELKKKSSMNLETL